MDPHPGGPTSGRPHTVMAGSERRAGRPGGRLGFIVGRFLGRRRTFLVDTGYQVRTALIAVLGMAFLIAFAASLFHLLTLENSRALTQQVPLLGPGVGEDDARSVLYLVAAGIVFVAAVFVIEILETHKTAGVVYKVTRGLRELESGFWGSKVTLRKHDNFKEMEEAFNAATQALRDQVETDLHGLQAIEGQIRLISREFESGNREGALVLLRQVAAELQGLRERKRNLLGTAGSGPFETKI